MWAEPVAWIGQRGGAVRGGADALEPVVSVERESGAEQVARREVQVDDVAGRALPRTEQRKGVGRLRVAEQWGAHRARERFDVSRGDGSSHTSGDQVERRSQLHARSLAGRNVDQVPRRVGHARREAHRGADCHARLQRAQRQRVALEPVEQHVLRADGDVADADALRRVDRIEATAE
jgi:hypothetical protein